MSKKEKKEWPTCLADCQPQKEKTNKKEKRNRRSRCVDDFVIKLIQKSASWLIIIKLYNNLWNM